MLVAVGLVYVVSTGIEFEVGSGSAVPAELALVPALFLLPATMVPLTVAGALLIGDLPAFVRGRLHLERAATTAAYAWYSVPPAIVMLLAGEPRPGVGSLPLLGAVLLAAQFARRPGLDAARPVDRPRRAGPGAAAADGVGVPGRLPARAGRPAGRHRRDGDGAAAVLLVLPLMLLVVVFARERTARISNVLELSSAYRGTALLLGDVIEADDSYTGSHSRDVVDLTTARSATSWACRAHAPAGRADGAAARRRQDRDPERDHHQAGKLTPEERAIIETHTIEGQRLLHRVGGALSEIGDIVRACHERWDGKGYPDGTAGEECRWWRGSSSPATRSTR